MCYVAWLQATLESIDVRYLWCLFHVEKLADGQLAWEMSQGADGPLGKDTDDVRMAWIS